MKIDISKDENRRLVNVAIHCLIDDLIKDKETVENSLVSEILDTHISLLTEFSDYLFLGDKPFISNKTSLNVIISYLTEFKLSLTHNVTYVTTSDTINLYLNAIEDIIKQIDKQIVDQLDNTLEITI